MSLILAYLKSLSYRPPIKLMHKAHFEMRYRAKRMSFKKRTCFKSLN